MKLLRLQTAAVLFLVVLVGLPSLSLAQGPSSATCQAIEKDGGFEQGDAWRFTDTPSPGFLDASVAHSGRQSAFLGLPLDAENIEADSTVWQTLQLPASDVITATMWLRTQPGDANDRRYVVVWDLAEDASTVLFYDQAPEEAWRQITLDLTPFAGKEIQLVMGVHNDGADQKAGMWVDDVRVLACSETAANTQTPAPSATPSPTPQAASPTPAPTATPSPAPTATPTTEPSATPTSAPTATPPPEPTATPLPTATPTVIPYTGTPTPPGPMPNSGSLPLLTGVLLSGLIAVGVIAISLRRGRTF